MTSDHEVGYGKPPKRNPFRKGQSGNPGGRPKGGKNLKTDLIEELQENITVREGDRTVRISKQRAIVNTLIAKTLKGDARAASALLSMVFRILDPEGVIANTDDVLSAEEQEIFAFVEERLLLRDNAVAKQPDRTDGEGSLR
jgi:hypothetical protein